MSEVKKVLEERGNRYGDFTDVARTTIEVQREIIYKGHITKEYQIAAIQMIASKLARIANGDPDYADNWIDIAGYAQLVVDELMAQQEVIND